MAVISLATTGVASADARTRVVTAGASIASGEVVYVSPSDNKAYKAEADSTALVANAVGVAVNTAVTGNQLTVLVYGKITALTGLKAGQTYLVSNVAGDIAEALADLTEDTSFVTFLGVGLSTTELLVAPVVSGVQMNLA